MNCAKCGDPMEVGRAEVHGAGLHAVMYRRFSFQDLYWYDRKRSKRSRRRVIASGEARTSYGCKPCGFISIDTSSTLKVPKKRRGRKRSDD